jgi:dipeptidase D
MYTHKYHVVSLIIAALLLVACSTPATQGIPASTALPTGVPAAEVSQATQSTVSGTETPSSPATNIALKDALGSLKPEDVFQNFYDITQVPRPSGHMDQIQNFLVKFGQGLGMETTVDEAGNVLIRKPAAAGFENRQGVVLQAHMDMVAQVADGKAFDPTTDPIQAFVNGDYVVADGTTLGADDGIGIAMIMAILQSKTLQLGPLEALFTVDEESDLSGANGLKPDMVQGRTLINLDSETEGIFTIGSAGGQHVNIQSSYPQAPAPANMVTYQVKVQGLKGGHSGAEINLGRGHATKLLVRLLKGAVKPYGLSLANITGGTALNAIPTDASALVFLPDKQVEAFTAYVRAYEATIRSELAAVEPDLSVELAAVQAPAQVMEETFQTVLIDALYANPQGVMRMSDTVPDQVETSTNMGITNAQDGQIQVNCLPRSSVDSELDDVSQMIASVWELAGYPVAFTDRSPAWTPNPDSPILSLMKATYLDLYGKEPEITAIHAGLECGTIGEKYPDMDMISIGPTLNDVHTVAERLFIPSVEKVMDLVTGVLQRIPEK